MATWLLEEIKKADIKAILDFPLPNRKEMFDIAPTLLHSYFTQTSAHKMEALERQELAAYNELVEGKLLDDSPYGKLLGKYLSMEDLQKYEELLSVEINKTIAHMEKTPLPDIPEQDIELLGKRAFQITSTYDFVKWDKEKLFSKLKFEVNNIIEDEETGIVVVTASWENTDKNIIIDGHIIAELYDENNLLVGNAFFSFPKLGTASPYSNGEFTSIAFNVLKSDSYNVVFKPYCLWEIKPKENIKATTVDELVNSNVGFDMADFTDLEIDYEIKKMESAEAKGIKEYPVDKLVSIRNDLAKKADEAGIKEKISFVTETINIIKSSKIQPVVVKDGKITPVEYIPLDKDSNAVNLFKGATREQINEANKFGHEKFIMYDEQKRAEFDEALRNVRQMGDIIASSAMVEKEHDWAVWGGIAEGLGGRAFGVATALQTQLENQEIRARNAANQRYANSQRQEIYDLVAKKERERPVVRTAMILYNQFKFIKWDQTELFKKIKVVTNSLVVSDDSAGFILYADFYGLDRNVIIDGTIRAKLYDENHLYVGQALLTLPEFGTAAEKNIFYGYIPNPPASKYYSVEYEPYYLWQIEANEDSPIKSATDLSWAMAKFGKPNLNALNQKHEDELHYANAMRLIRTNNLYALSEAQEEIKLLGTSIEAKAYVDKFNAATITLKDDIYNSAVRLSESKYYSDVEEAVERFSPILDWRDSRALSEKASAKAKDIKNEEDYQNGIIAFKKKDYALAKTHFTACIDWKDSKEYVNRCEQGITNQKKSKNIKAIIIFILFVISTIAIFMFMREKQYNEALSYLNNGDYANAYPILIKLKDYNDSISKAKEIESLANIQSIRSKEVGDTVFIGKYEQNNILDDDGESIEWIILKKTNSKAMLISAYTLDIIPYNSKREVKPLSWGNSNLREWLNTDFYNNAFNETEKIYITDTSVTEDITLDMGRWDKEEYSNEVGMPDPMIVKDKIFVLSTEEVDNLYECGLGRIQMSSYVDDKEDDMDENYYPSEFALRSILINMAWDFGGTFCRSVCFPASDPMYDEIGFTWGCPVAPVMWVDFSKV